jgi:hypothetical protein
MIFEIRKNNVLNLLAKHDLNNAQFSKKIDRAETQVSRFLCTNATKNIGDKMARHIEDCFKIECGVLDIRSEKTSALLSETIKSLQILELKDILQEEHFKVLSNLIATWE